jgi:hypothetical protein
MANIAYFEFTEAWGGQSAVWTRLHDPQCYIYADYYGIGISGEWEHMDVAERLAIVSVVESARHFHLRRVQEVEKKSAAGNARIDQGG